ncbi:MAG: electron transport complex subunit RsxG [Gallionellales bacterium 35-53-114]|jgi:electron transport complex protein RnfG|nr:MAG: electron transport complex subunit RsxG [Gallionellales bacterium 35-53-114]OYZ62297.1 MAG: electron transport complex subunit RsxG [Gallionellales bacterium 24-53-125]OZB10582.1 MAG: electron transport complex subunit RsxG [Gallionellales bacterium 39-52-133]HQS57213.1 electron transport complex subunit RsxG [Gallionellaceae bacterium]HQS74599.1 electron transport complex subunit RsxG [Gallionellaceae bacterium]
MKRLTKATLRTALNLFFFTVIGTTILAYTFNLTHERIAQSEAAAKLKLINQVAPTALYDNDLLNDTVTLPASAQLGTEQETPAYRGRLKGQPSVVVIEAIAPDGYSGKISLIVAINYDGVISGVRVVAHKETPGLGDYIDIAKNKWISLFGGASHQRYQEDDWKVKKDGGQIDYMAGATITPRAVAKAVHKALHYFEENRARLFAQQADN